MSILPLPCGQSKENGFFFGDRYCYWNGGRVCTLILCPIEDKLDSFKLTHELLAFLKCVHGEIESSFFNIMLYLKFKKHVSPNKFTSFPLDGRVDRKRKKTL